MNGENRQTVWREGNRIRRTDGVGYGDQVSDRQIREHIDAHRCSASSHDQTFVAFAEAVLAIRKVERVTRPAVKRNV